MDLHVRYGGDGDLEKYTAKELERLGMAVLHGSDRKTPYGIVPNLYADRALSSADADTGALVTLDCSWESAGETMFSLPDEHRAPPYLVAVNSVNFGRPMQLTTVEVIATALVIFGEKRRAEDVLSEFNWGHTFLELDEEPLRRYVACADSTKVVKIQREYLRHGE